MKPKESKLIDLWMKSHKPVDLLFLDPEGLPVDIESVVWEEYWVEKNIVGEDEIIDYLYMNDAVNNSLYDWTEERMLQEAEMLFERLQEDGEVVRRLVVKMEVPNE